MRELRGIFAILSALTFREGDADGVVAHLRRLAGSNCVIIERGKAPRYYKCIGCVIEEAMSCVDDMRMNKVSSYHIGNDFACFKVIISIAFYTVSKQSVRLRLRNLGWRV
jgi:hypothetical protein